ncbi:hypothetical protein EDB87DRAFT_1017020 [Lactarius vividus]|nr:hypothetical protein EDB87DRAFT_1017020 [Lactarius vividus]
MTDGRAQIAMDESIHRKKRDARAIGWVLGNLTEDSELEPFILGIPGLLSSRWGNRVWDAVAEGESNGNAIVQGGDQLELPLVLRNPSHPTDQQATTILPLRHEDTLHELGTRITRLLKTCTDPGILPTEDARRKRARACVDAALSLVLSTEYDWEWSAEPEILAQTLVYLGNVEKIREVPVGGFESAFATPWTCMSIIAVRKMLHTPMVHDAAQRVITCLVNVRGEGVDHADDEATKTAGTIDQYLKACWESACTLHRELVKEVETDKIEERCHEIMLKRSDDIEVLEDRWNRFGWAEEIDEAIISLVLTMIYASNGILEYLPDVVSPWQSDPRRVPDKGTRAIPPYLMSQFIPPRLLAQRLWLCVWTLRNISASGLVSGTHQPKSLGELSAPELQVPKISNLMDNTQAPIATQLWRLQDLRDGGLAYVLELFIAAVKFSKSASHLLSQPLYIGTFHNITSDWTERRHAIWTQRLLVDLLRRVLPANDSPADVVPGYIIDEFLIFMGKYWPRRRDHMLLRRFH